MDQIQKTLIKAGRKDLAQKYFKIISAPMLKSYMAFLYKDNGKTKLGIRWIKPMVKIGDLKADMPEGVLELDGGGSYLLFESSGKADALRIAKLKLRTDISKNK